MSDTSDILLSSRLHIFASSPPSPHCLRAISPLVCPPYCHSVIFLLNCPDHLPCCLRPSVAPLPIQDGSQIPLTMLLPTILEPVGCGAIVRIQACPCALSPYPSSIFPSQALRILPNHHQQLGISKTLPLSVQGSLWLIYPAGWIARSPSSARSVAHPG